MDTVFNTDSTFKQILRFLFSALCHLDLNCGFLSVENFKVALSSIQRQPKLECLKDCSILELYILVCVKRLEVREQETCNFNSIMKEYKIIHDSFQTTDYYARDVCRRAFEHLLQRELISFLDNRGHGHSIDFRPVKLLISWQELHQGLKSYGSCPAILYKLVDRETPAWWYFSPVRCSVHLWLEMKINKSSVVTTRRSVAIKLMPGKNCQKISFFL